MAKGHQVGVLFVHGMGEQGRGETIGQMGEAVAEWLRRETEARDPKASGGTLPAAGHGPQANKATIRHVALADPHPELPDTAQIHIAFEPKLNAQDKRKGGVATPVARWLLAESWWAQSFRPASFLETALWTIGVGPWIIAAQLDAVLRRQASFGWRLLLGLPLVFAAAIAAAVIAPLAVLLLILALLPVPGLGNVVAGIQRNLAGSYGDLSRLVRNPVQFAAMWSRVERDIQLLSAHCDRVVIVAHSQGSAIAWMALRRWADRLLAASIEDAEPEPVPDLLVDADQAVVSQAPVAADDRAASPRGAPPAGGEQDAAGSRSMSERPGGADDQQDAPPTREKVAMFISFGQAMRKLKMLYMIHTEAGFGQRATFIGLSLVGTAALLLAAAALFSGVWDLALGRSLTAATDSWRPAVLVIALLVLAAVQLFMVLLSRGWVTRTEKELTEEAARVLKAMPDLRWHDLWASADPAPNGPLFEALPDRVSTHKVRNFGSTILDHTTYWSNLTEFVSEVVEQANAYSGPQPLDTRTGDNKRRTVQVRDARVRMLTIGRVVFFASLAAAVAIADGPAVGRGILAEVGRLLGLLGQGPVEWEYSGLLGYGAIIAVGLAIWFAMLKGFNAIVGADDTAYFANMAPQQWTGWFAAGWVVIGAVGLSAGYWLWSNDHQAVTWIWLLAVVIGVGLVAGVLTRGGETLAPPEQAAEGTGPSGGQAANPAGG